jgi:hypothetical protein
MAKQARLLIVAGTLVAGLTGPVRAASPERSVVLYVDDYRNVPAYTLVNAEREASRIYVAAGLPIRWASDSPADPGDIRRLRVIILSREMTELKVARDGIGPRTLAQASRGAARAYIFYDRVVEAAPRYAPTLEKLLGWVLAHEVGHLLLPDGGHSDRGIMRATFDRHGTLFKRFTAAQSLLLHQLVPDAITGR